MSPSHQGGLGALIHASNCMVHTHAFSDFKLKETGILPPYSNTGVLKPDFTLRPDYLSGTFPMIKAKKSGEEITLWLWRQFCRHLGGTTMQKRGGRNGWKHGMQLSNSSTEKELGSVFWGGQRGRIFFELKGGICKLFTPDEWAKIHMLLKRYEGRINRFDLAGDDWGGKYFKIPEIKAAYKKNNRLLNPSAAAKASYHLPLGEINTYKGWTLEHGTNDSMFFHVIYQKFRESAGTHLANMNPDWMRWEARMYRQGKSEIDIAVVHPDNWGSAYLGSCVYLENLFGKSGRAFTYRPATIKQDTIDRFTAAYRALEAQWAPFLAECTRLGLEVPTARFSGHESSPYAELSPSDLPFLKECIDCARRGEMRSTGTRAQSAADFPDW